MKAKQQIPRYSRNPRYAELPASEFGTQAELRSSFGRGSIPVAVVITCWELGGIAGYAAHARSGELMVVQNPAGIVPAWGDGDPGSVVAAVCYGLALPTVRHLIVCGHKACRTMPVLLEDHPPKALPQLHAIVHESDEDFVPCDESLSDDERYDEAAQEIILQQIRHLKSYPEVQQRLAADELRLHGWYYDDRRSMVREFNPATRQFAD